MENQSDRLLETAGETITYAQEYWVEQKQLFKLEVAERTAKVASSLLSNVIIGLAASMVVLLLSIALAFGLGYYFENIALGFLAVAGIYLLSLGVLIFFKTQWVTNPILSRIIEDFFD